MLNNINLTYVKQKNNSKNKKPMSNKNSKKKNNNTQNTSNLNYNIIVTKKTPIPNNISLNNNNFINNININGDFLSLSNNITYLIKDHFHSNKLYISNIKLISESINEQTLFSRSAINDILLYLNQIVKPRYNNTMANMNEKYIKDKLYQINLRMEKINELKDSLIQNIRNNETSLISFYEEINNLLEIMKIVISKKDVKIYEDKLNFSNLFDNNNNKTEFNSFDLKSKINEDEKKLMKDISNEKNKNKTFELIDLETMKDKYLEIYHKQKQKIINDNNTNIIDSNNSRNNENINIIRHNRHDLTKGRNKRSSSANKSKTEYSNHNLTSINIRPSSYSRAYTIEQKTEPNSQLVYKNNYEYINENIIKNNITQKINLNNINLIDLSKFILNFFNDMECLQEMIINKSKNIKEFKFNFEISKNNLKKACEKILKQNKNEIIDEKEQKTQKKEIENYKHELDEMAKKNEKLKKEIQKVEEEKMNKSKIIVNLGNKMNEIQTELQNIKNKNLKVKEDMKSMKDNNKKLNENIKIIRDENSKLNKNIILTEEENKKLKKNINSKENTINNNFNNIKQENNKLTNKLKLKDEENKKVINLNNQLKEDNQKLNNAIDQLKDENQKLRNNIKLIEEENKKLADINLKETENKKINNNTQEENNKVINQLKEENSKLNDKINIIEEINKNLNNNLEKIKEEKLNLNENINKLKEENTKLNNIINEINKENSILKENNNLKEEAKLNISRLENELKLMRGENKSLSGKNLKLKDSDNKNKKIIDEMKNKINLIENENKSLKIKIDEINEKNNKNDELIKEKDKIINDLKDNIKEQNENIKELSDKIKNLNDINISEISNNNKDLNLNLHEEEMDNIKNILKDLNEKTEVNIKNIMEKDNQFNVVKKDYNKKINDVYDQDFQPTKNIIQDLLNNQNEYDILLKQFKSSNEIFTKLN